MQRKMNQSLFQLILSCSLLIHETRAHGYLASPRSRNFVANQEGLGEKKDPVPGVPYVEYCHACLTRNAGICGLSIHDHNYDDWLDSTGSPMPWTSQATYEQGGIIRINSIIKAHHLGHFEVSACPDGRASTQECFDQHRLTFVQDIAHGMPADPKHPERGYLSLGEEFSMDFKLPDDVAGENVLLQWRYVSANSCNPVDYHEYFRGSNSDNEILPEEYWNSQLTVCNYPLPLDGSRGFLKPEQFFNCAEITILPSSSASVETVTKSPASSPVSSSLVEDLTSRIDASDIQQTATIAPTRPENAAIDPIVQETITYLDSSVTKATASPVASPISPAPTVSPIPEEATSPSLSATETKIATSTPVNAVPSGNIELDDVEAEKEDFEQVTKPTAENSHNNDIEDEKTNSITEGTSNAVQAFPLDNSDSAGSRSLSSLLFLSVVCIVQQFW